ncbi:unnamed protein product [Brugia pahangi]|uniref:Ig-like domain-containing protein n=1 Tax=Brugia pahangi TaxID=6280 RepID=A0A0N4T0M8_BRUPA|nr:unnamed protein product [Brugia pahangi]
MYLKFSEILSKLEFGVCDRFLGFHFTEEPTNTVAKAGRIELNCRYAISMRNTSSRTEWRKDGAELASLRPTGKM